MGKSHVLKKWIAVSLALLVPGVGAGIMNAPQPAGITVQAATGDLENDDLFCFQEEEDGTWAVSACYVDNVSGKDIVIPDTYKGKAVTVLKTGMFGDHRNSGKVYSLTLGKNIREVEEYALDGIHMDKIDVRSSNNSFAIVFNSLYTKDRKTLVYCPDMISGKVNVSTYTVTIRDDAFLSDQVTEIRLGQKVAQVPEDGFAGCSSLVQFSIDASNPNFTVKGGVLLSADGTELYAYPKAKTGGYVVPSTVRTVRPYSFAGAQLSSINLNLVDHIGAYSFSDCDKLRSVVIKANTKAIGEGAFSECDLLSAATIEKGVRYLPAHLFYNCPLLNSLRFPTSVTAMGVDVFANTRWLQKKADGFVYVSKMLYGYKGSSSIAQTLNIKEGTVGIAEGALRGAYVTKVVFPSSMEYLTAGQLFPAENIRYFEVAADNPYFTAVNQFVFTKNREKLICAPARTGSSVCSLPPSVTEIGDYAFKFNTDIKKIYLSNSVTKFGLSPFYNGDSERTVVCMPGSAAAQAARLDNVNLLYPDIGIALSAKDVTLGVGEDRVLSATITPEIAVGTVSWRSSDTSVVTVINGKLHAVRAGTATITATESNGSSTQCSVTVKAAPKRISFSNTVINVGEGELYTLTDVVDIDAACTDKTYTSSRSSVVSVQKTASGCLLRTHKTGSAIITVTTYNGKKAQCKVTVMAAPESIAFDKTQITIGVGETARLSTSVNNGAASMTRIYTSTNTSKVQMVEAEGSCTFTGVAVGTSYIMVRTYNGKTSQCKVMVKSPPKSISMEKSEVNIGIGESMTLGSTVLSTVGCATRTYSSSDNSIVKMTKTDWKAGFTGMKVGTAYITVRSYNGREGTCRVNVKAAPTSVTLNKTQINLKVGQSATLTSTVPSGTAATDRVYSTSDSSIVKMTRTNWQGEFTALKAGTCYVTVRTYNGKEASCKVVVS